MIFYQSILTVQNTQIQTLKQCRVYYFLYQSAFPASQLDFQCYDSLETSPVPWICAAQTLFPNNLTFVKFQINCSSTKKMESTFSAYVLPLCMKFTEYFNKENGRTMALMPQHLDHKSEEYSTINFRPFY